MKKLLFISLSLSITLLCVFKVDANQLTFPLIGKIIVIDPGHGGKDRGADYNDIYESELNLAISLELKKALEKSGATVLMTREDNYDLSSPNVYYRKKNDFDNRIKLINNSNADLYLSNHLNSILNCKNFGPQVFYDKKITENKIIAEMIQTELNIALEDTRKIGVLNPNNYYLYKQLNTKGVLIECGFLSNASDRKKLQTEKHQQKIARTINRAIIKYYS